MSISKRAAGAARHLVVVAYDVSNGRRRGQMAKALLGFGERVQKSVFECRVSEREREKMTKIIDGLRRPTDCVRYYEICGACEQRISGVPPRGGQASAVVVA